MAIVLDRKFKAVFTRKWPDQDDASICG